MYVNALENKLKGKLTDDEWEQLLKTKELVNRAVLETRTISHNIMPNSLSEFGLSQTIEEVCEDISKINEAFTQAIKNWYSKIEKEMEHRRCSEYI